LSQKNHKISTSVKKIKDWVTEQQMSSSKYKQARAHSIHIHA
jgi:hypothetical protein